MKHKHYDMIVTKAANMDLVIFIKLDGKWEVGSHESQIINFGSHYEYFLCLPQHKEVCLHYLNGGDVLVKSNLVPSWATVTHGQSWGAGIGWMREDAQYRIKPKKEKRWIGVNVTTGKTTSAYTHDDEGNYAEDEVRLTNGNLSEWQFIEIEVEV